MQNKHEKRSPLKALPLRHPGQSLEEKFYDTLYGEIMLRALFIFFIFTIAVYDWSRVYLNARPQPLWWFMIGVIVTAIFFKDFKRYWRELRNLQLGIDGEQIVGQSLEELVKKGYKVFHDIVNEGFNIDHILVGPGGVFTIETKTVSKSLKGHPSISFDGTKIKIDGFAPDRDPITQVKGQVYWLENFITENAKIKVKVRPVVVYPGWYVNQTSPNPDIWVLNEKALLSYLANEKTSINDEQINLISSHLESYIRRYKRV
ncbi:MAG: nuclease-related domain-containing protein [Candidatus Paceibacterota bacterium]